MGRGGDGDGGGGGDGGGDWVTKGKDLTHQRANKAPLLGGNNALPGAASAYAGKGCGVAWPLAPGGSAGGGGLGGKVPRAAGSSGALHVERTVERSRMGSAPAETEPRRPAAADAAADAAGASAAAAAAAAAAAVVARGAGRCSTLADLDAASDP